MSFGDVYNLSNHRLERPVCSILVERPRFRLATTTPQIMTQNNGSLSKTLNVSIKLVVIIHLLPLPPDFNASFLLTFSAVLCSAVLISPFLKSSML
jgi:hypothetical protein